MSSVKTMVHLPQQIEEASATIMDRLDALDRILEEMHTEKIPKALGWIRDVGALLKIRKNVEDLKLKAFRIEARLFWRLVCTHPNIELPATGSLLNLSGHEFSRRDAQLMRVMQEWSQDQFAKFVQDYGNESFWKSVYQFRDSYSSFKKEPTWYELTPEEREKETVRHRSVIDALAAEERQESLRAAVNEEINSLLSESSCFEVSDVAIQLAEKLGIDSDDVSMAGLCQVVRSSINRQIPETENTLSGQMSRRLKEAGLSIPRAVCFEECGKWMRVSFHDSNIYQLASMSKERARKAEEFAESAMRLKSLVEFLQSNDPETGDEPAKCMEILKLCFGKNGMKTHFSKSLTQKKESH